MPDREFIHATADVLGALSFALDNGLAVMLDAPQAEPRPCMIGRADLGSLNSGVFQLFRPEWVFGQFQVSRIDEGHNAGKYFVHSHTNYSPVSVYFQGERLEHGKRKLGAGEVSFKREWLRQPTGDMRPTPPEVEAFFKQLTASMFSGIVVKAGVHRYKLCREAAKYVKSGQAIPPFDFIEWADSVP